MLSILFTYLSLTLLRINQKWRSTVLGTVWMKRRKRPTSRIAYSQNRHDGQKLGKGDRNPQQQTQWYFHSPSITGGRDRNVISKRERQSKGRSERRRTGRRVEPSGTSSGETSHAEPWMRWASQPTVAWHQLVKTVETIISVHEVQLTLSAAVGTNARLHPQRLHIWKDKRS